MNSLIIPPNFPEMLNHLDIMEHMKLKQQLRCWRPALVQPQQVWRFWKGIVFFLEWSILEDPKVYTLEYSRVASLGQQKIHEVFKDNKINPGESKMRAPGGGSLTPYSLSACPVCVACIFLSYLMPYHFIYMLFLGPCILFYLLRNPTSPGTTRLLYNRRKQVL